MKLLPHDKIISMFGTGIGFSNGPSYPGYGYGQLAQQQQEAVSFDLEGCCAILQHLNKQELQELLDNDDKISELIKDLKPVSWFSSITG